MVAPAPFESLVSPHAHQHLILLVIFILGTLGVVTVALLCISLVTSDTVYLFVCLLAVPNLPLSSGHSIVLGCLPFLLRGWEFLLYILDISSLSDT